MKHLTATLKLALICGLILAALSGCDRSRRAWDGFKQEVRGLAG